MTQQTNPLAGLERFALTYAGRSHDVYRGGAVGLDPEALHRVTQRTREGLCVLGLRFTNDQGCPPERFVTLRRELGAAFEGIEIDSSPGNAYGIPTKAHSVLTVDLVDEQGHPTRAAIDRVLALLHRQLRP